MFLISWNVAGLSTTLAKIDQDYKEASIASSSTPASKLSRSHSFSYFLQRHGDPDILCIQEHKIPIKQLASRSEPFGCSEVDGYESFWSCCTDAQKKGFNGVVTYAKRGTVQSADCRPLGCPELDDQGRAVMTDHGDFVVFNVYVPASGGNSLTYKMKFLNALRRAMRYQRDERQKKVILVGDLNISYSGIDVYYKYRTIRINQVLQEVQNFNAADDKSESNALPQWKIQVAHNWNQIESALQTLEAKPIETKNPANGSTFLKYRALVHVQDKNVLLGGYEQSEKDCVANFQFPSCSYFDEDLKVERIATEGNVVYLDTLAELMSKIAQIHWDDGTLKSIANTDGLYKMSPTVEWLQNILEEDSMCDVFRHFWPNAEGRFTCWNQQTNRRYENDGIRIDYTIVDYTLIDFVEKSEKLRCCDYAGDNFCSEEASLHAATASNQFQGAGFGGGGIANGTVRALETQFGECHSGMIYTPPSYSDHIAVSLQFHKRFEPHFSKSLSLNSKDTNTKKSQPQKTQQSISSFFSTSTNAVPKSSNASSKRPLNKTLDASTKKPKGTLFAHFDSTKK